MNRKAVLEVVKSAAKFFFDLEPEITEILALQAAARAGKAYDDTVPVIVEAYRCQKHRLIAFMNKEERERQYQLAA